MNLNENFQIHSQLNPKLWDSAGQLLPEVKKGLVEIVKTFEQELTLPITIIDVQLVGSNAGYNYTEESDIDCHIIANFEMIDCDPEILKAAYDLAKSNFNKNHKITIHGLEVELYIQDVGSACISNGIYSVLDNEWIKEPKPINSVSKKNVEKEMEAWRQHTAKIIAEKDETAILNAINTIYLLRHNSLAAEGEFGKDAQLFKELRSSGIIDRLKDEYRQLVDNRLTVEHLCEFFTPGQLVQRMNISEFGIK